MKNSLASLLIVPLILISCGKAEVTVETVGNQPTTAKPVVATGSVTETNAPRKTDTTNPELEPLSQQSPFRELYESKKWKLIGLPKGIHWEFTTEKWAPIIISYSGNPHLEWKKTLSIKNISITDISDCLEWKNKEWVFSEDDPIFVKADCKKYYHGFEFNGKKVEYDFKNSMDGIWISKTDSKVAIFWGKLVIDFEKGNYVFNESAGDMERAGFILLARID